MDESQRQVFVTYLFWGDAYDEWIPFGSSRLAPANSEVYVPGGQMKMNQRIEVRDTAGKWLEAEVIAVRGTSHVRIHYRNWHPKFDEELPQNSDRIRQFGRKKALKKERIAIPRSRMASVCPQNARPRARTMAANSQPFLVYQETLLNTHHLRVQQVDGDGNCMFRSVSHQVYGDERYHMLVRTKCMDYMELEREYFAHFVEGDMNDFLQYLAHKRRDGIWGDDPEIQALCELYDRPAQIWIYDQHNGARVLRTFHEAQAGAGCALDPQAAQQQQQAGIRPSMRLSFYGGGHYDSVVGADHELHLIRTSPGVEEDQRLEAVRQRLAAGGYEETKHQSDMAATEQAQLAQALQASRDMFDNLNQDLDDIFTEMALTGSERDRMEQDMLQQHEQNELQQALSISANAAGAVSGDNDPMFEQALAASVVTATASSSHPPSSSSAAAAAAFSSDPELTTALEMSAAVTEDPELKYALELSKHGTTSNFDDEEEMRLALQISAQEHSGGAVSC